MTVDRVKMQVTVVVKETGEGEGGGDRRGVSAASQARSRSVVGYLSLV